MIVRCKYCGEKISFPDAVDENGHHYPVFDRVVWKETKSKDGVWQEAMWNADCQPPEVVR